MLPVDPRRPEKVQRYVAKSGNGQEDLTPDYMNILGQHQTTANACEAPDKHSESTTSAEPNLQVASLPLEAVHSDELSNTIATSNATNVIPTSPQYGLAIIPTETVTAFTETVTDATTKPPDEAKVDPQSTPSRNERFKVVKIASLEPFKRGRWKCMDYVDEHPPQSSQSKLSHSSGNVQLSSTAGYMQTQSMPQQQIHQYLVQGGFTNGSQFFAPNVQTQMMPQNPYFYQPQVTSNMQTQTLPQQVPAFINSSQPYFHGVQNAGFGVQNYPNPNVQYVPVQNQQNSAFVPTSQTVVQLSNFQQSQTYAGQPLVNGHNFPAHNQQDQQVSAGSLPAQTAKSVILNSNVQQTLVNQNQMQNNQQQQPVYAANPSFQQQQQQQQQQPPQQQVITQQPQNFECNVYSNPHFAIAGSASSLANLDQTEAVAEPISSAAEPTETQTNPVVNAIDNKIEQAMDLVKSHLMYTVREEVEVLKEKISELMEKIQQLETENNQLKSQIGAKTNGNAAAPSSLPPPTPSMIFSMCGLMMRLKWCAWVALYCSCVSFANSRVTDDTKQILSSFMLSISSVVMSYLQNPQPMTPPWASVPFP
ncbi:unnamed protein product [Brassicogethes aeneus]|uniref:Protein Asterix n=1 Tax=Brassicogethes aeneus TaxID=1431903 RepID=A0A9P0FC83_BRAAE|nr:unnamed protein product [Brassicogethes aeneus]